jgi:hypothetical protein
MQVNESNRIEIPVYTDQEIRTNAISMVIDVTNSGLKPIGIKSGLTGFVWNVIGKQIRFAWYGMESLVTKSDEPLFFIFLSLSICINLSTKHKFILFF